MTQYVNIYTFTIGSFFFLKILKGLRAKQMTIWSLFAVLFYVFQFVPLIGEILYYGEDLNFSAINIIKALSDPLVAIVYDVIIIVVIWYLYYRSRRADKYFNLYFNRLKHFKSNYAIKIVSIFFMVFPLILALLSPHPEIYLKWAYSYTHDLSIEEEIFHDNIMVPSLQISTFSFALYYSQKNKKRWFAYLMMFVLTWLSFKRTDLVFMSFIVLGLDYVSGSYNEKISKLWKKSLILFTICVCYFIAYSNYTGKGKDSDSYASYTMYYARNYCVKTAIYDQLNGNKMLDYRGQTILFDFFFYVPRSYWNDKPAMYSKYSTAFSQGRMGYDATTNYYVNIWAEYISNFYFFGVILAFVFIHIFLRISERSNNLFVYLMGVVFLSFYFFWGVQPFTMLMIGMWATGLLYSKMKSTKAKRVTSTTL